MSIFAIESLCGHMSNLNESKEQVAGLVTAKATSSIICVGDLEAQIAINLFPTNA